MTAFRNRPIKQKLTILIMLISTSVVLLTCIILGVTDLFSYRNSLIHKIETLGEVIGRNNTASIIFQDKGTAFESLSALESEPNVVSASILNESGNIFVQYHGQSTEKLIAPDSHNLGVQFQNNYLLSLRPIFLGEEIIGYIFIQADLKGLYARLWWYGGVVLGVLLISFLVAYFLTANFQKVISDPILNLTNVVKDIKSKKDTKIRAEITSLDEVGQLTVSFNEMLVELNLRNKALETSERNLALSNKIIAGLSHVAAKIVSAKNPEDVLNMLGDELKKLGFYCFIGNIDLKNKTIIAWYSSFGNKILKTAEKLAGFNLNGYQIPYERFKYYKKLFYRQQPVFISNLTDEVKLAIPQLPSGLVAQILKVLGFRNNTPSISVPMVIDKTTTGILSVWGKGLKKEDVSAITVFGNQVTIAIQNARLYNKARAELVERLKIENKLREAHDELESKVQDRTGELLLLQKEKERFISRVSHDLRTPIAAIMGFSQLLSAEKWGILNDEQTQKIEKIVGHSVRLDKIVDDLLSVSKIEAGVMGTKKEEVMISDVIRKAINEMLIIANYKSQQIEFNNIAADQMVIGDSDAIYQTMLNLIDNALKYNSDGGKVFITTQLDDNYLIIQISDEGIGLNEEEIKLVFEEFYRAAMTGEVRIQGTGLGLSIVKRLVNQMNGKVWVESKGAGHGCTFSFTLPLK
ncbi:MAG: HAMP domain-containing protein [Candidatus Marinimicrobia bacterium]|nr:HAMP domain-containing protein [Candidatus Neomarinimicrobiota bacterium]